MVFRKMAWWEYIVYSILPLLGQVLLRVIRLGGSLSRPWLFIPIFWIPPFTLIPVLIATFSNYIKPTNSGKVYDHFIIIPIIIKLLLSFLPLHTGDYKGMYIIILVGSLLIANTIHILKNETCEKIGSKLHTVFLRALSDSFIQYSIGFILVFLCKIIGKFIPVIKAFSLILLNNPTMYKITLFILWAFGLVGGYMLSHMYDNNVESDESICKKSPHILKIIIGFILFIGIILYEINKTINKLQ